MESLLEKDLETLKKQEDKFIAIFGNQTVYDRGFQKYKMKLLNEITARHSGYSTHENKMLIEMIKVERRRLERQLYPNLVRRLFQRAKVQLYDMPRYLRKEALNQSNSSDNLYNLARSIQPANASTSIESVISRQSTGVEWEQTNATTQDKSQKREQKQRVPRGPRHRVPLTTGKAAGLKR